MSDQFYAVEYRNMHSAIHHVAIFSCEDKAQQFHGYIEEEMELPPENFYEPLNFVGDYETDHRAPPTHTPDEYEIRLIYINDLDNRKNNVCPDVY